MHVSNSDEHRQNLLLALEVLEFDPSAAEMLGINSNVHLLSPQALRDISEQHDFQKAVRETRMKKAIAYLDHKEQDIGVCEVLEPVPSTNAIRSYPRGLRLNPQVSIAAAISSMQPLDYYICKALAVVRAGGWLSNDGAVFFWGGALLIQTQGSSLHVVPGNSIEIDKYDSQFLDILAQTCRNILASQPGEKVRQIALAELSSIRDMLVGDDTVLTGWLDVECDRIAGRDSRDWL